jgi:glycosyltransferase involved in cell wall biosynthesis
MPEADRPLRLAFVANPTHILVERWVNFFARRGHEVTVLDGFGFPDARGLDDRVRLVRYDARGPIRLPLAPTLHARRTLRRLLAEIRPDVVHGHSLKRYGWQVGVAGWHPYVISTWGSDVLLPPAGAQARFWNRWTMRRADLVTAVSPLMRQAAIRAGARSDRVVQVHFGVDTERFSPAETTVRAGAPLVFSPRAIKPIYNHETILSAFAELDADVRMVMTGRNADAAHREAMTRRIAELGIRQRVEIVDDISDDEMLSLYRSATVVVSVPLSDSFPISLLEAMACGTPVVAGDLPTVRAGLEDVVPEWIVPTRSPDAVAAALRRAIAMAPSEREQLGAALRRRALESDHEANMLRMETLYRGLVDRG